MSFPESKVSRPVPMPPLSMSHAFRSSISTMASCIDVEIRSDRELSDDCSYVSLGADSDSDSCNNEETSVNNDNNTNTNNDSNFTVHHKNRYSSSRVSAGLAINHFPTLSTISSNASSMMDARHENHIDSFINSMDFGVNHKRSAVAVASASAITDNNNKGKEQIGKKNKPNSNSNDRGNESDHSNTDSDNSNSNSNTTTSSISTENEELIAALEQIKHKFDVLFPFYLLSDKDCKKLSLLVFNQINKIDKIFCDSKGRFLQAKIYYYNSKIPKTFNYYNNDDREEEVSEWNDILMNEEYCRIELNQSANA